MEAHTAGDAPINPTWSGQDFRLTSPCARPLAYILESAPGLFAALTIGSSIATAQNVNGAREEANQLVVMVTCTAAGKSEIGAGIIFNADDKGLHIATADHVIRACRRSAPNEGVEVRVRSRPNNTYPAILLAERDSSLDLALLRINRDAAIDTGGIPFDRLGHPDSLPQGFSHYEEAIAISFDSGKPWSLNRASDLRTDSGEARIRYQTQGKEPGTVVSDSAARGQAGGALYSRRDLRLIGMVLKDTTTRSYHDGEALRIDVLIDRLRAWNLPVKLVRQTPPGTFATLAIGTTHMCGLSGGDAYCWGENDKGQLGNGTGDARPSRVLGRIKFKSLYATNDATCGLSLAGTLFCWGAPPGVEPQQTDSGSIPRAITADVRFDSFSLGVTHACGLTASGAAYCWGANDHGQLGNGTVRMSDVPVVVAGNKKFKAVSAGLSHTCALTADGRAYCWGDNKDGALGNGTDQSARAPVSVAGGRVFESLSSSGNGSTCAVTPRGAAFCWGKNETGMLGNGSWGSARTPSAVAGGLVFSVVKPGNTHSCGIAGKAYCWGYNAQGQLGTGTEEFSNVPQPVKTDLEFVALFLGGGLTCALTRNGEAYCWGDAHSRAQAGAAFNEKGENVPVRLQP